MSKQRIAVIGLGHFGETLAIEAQANGIDVLAIDIDEEKVNNIADHVSEAIIADCTNVRAVRAIEWQQFITVVVAIGSDIKNSLMTVIHLQEAGVTTLWCKVQDQYHAALVSRLGVHKVISPEEEIARRVGRTIQYPDMVQQMLVGQSQYLAEIQIIRRLKRQELVERLNAHRHTLVAVQRHQAPNFDPVTELPDCLYPGDRVLVLSQYVEDGQWPPFTS
ncbi:MAG: potassium channel family protein [Saccharospirillum sp.]